MFKVELFVLWLLGRPRYFKRSIVLLLDCFLCMTSVYFSYFLRLEKWVELDQLVLFVFVSSLMVFLAVFHVFGLYRAIFRYNDKNSSKATLQALCIYGISFAIVFGGIGFDGIPRSLGFLQPIILGCMVLLSRYFIGYTFHFLLKTNIKTNEKKKNVIIYGAGKYGWDVLVKLKNKENVKIVGLVDEDLSMHGKTIDNYKIFPATELESLIFKHNVTSVHLATDASSVEKRKKLVNRLVELGVAVQVPSQQQDFFGMSRAVKFRVNSVDINDLIDREPVHIDYQMLEAKNKGKTILISGAGGSIGRELCKLIEKLAPKKMILVDQSEYALYQVMEELAANQFHSKPEMIPMLSSIGDLGAVEKIMRDYSPDTIYHAAAFKHVAMVELNAVESIKNNVFGTVCLANAANKYKVTDFVFVSTDKAVEATTLMGKTKRLSELYLQYLNQTTEGTAFSSVRFGNVMGSSGSVIPKFMTQIREGGPITLSHPEVKRFFMTPSEAAALVVQAGVMARGGEVHILDMGEPIKIQKIALKMIYLSGLKPKTKEHPDGDIEIKVVGLQKGEKLDEVLFKGSSLLNTAHKSIFKCQSLTLSLDQLQRLKDGLGTLEMSVATKTNDETAKFCLDEILRIVED